MLSAIRSLLFISPFVLFVLRTLKHLLLSHSSKGKEQTNVGLESKTIITLTGDEHKVMEVFIEADGRPLDLERIEYRLNLKI